MAIHRLTKQYIDNLTCPDEGQEVTWDRELRGFGLVVSRTAKSYVAQRDVHGRTIRVTLGRHGVMTCAQARAAARQALATMARGVDPREERRRQEAMGRTLAGVFEDFTAARKALAPRTVHEYRRLITTYSADWMDRPLARITPAMVIDRHTEIRDGVAAEPRTRLADGRTTANAWARVIRALWNFERSPSRTPGLADNPAGILSAQRAWYRERPRTGRLTAETLPDWFREVLALPNTTQRDYLITVLLTGMRRNEAAPLRWEDISAGTITVKAKGDRVRSVPIGRWLATLLAERREILNGTVGVFVFPGTGVTGYLHEPRSALAKVANASGIQEVSVHDLRRTFASIAADSAPYPAVKALLGHSPGRDVTLVHYSQPSPGELARHMQTIEGRILALAGLGHAPPA